MILKRVFHSIFIPLYHIQILVTVHLFKKKGFGLPSCNKDRYINFYLCAIIDAIFTFKDKSSLLGLLWGFSQTLNE